MPRRVRLDTLIVTRGLVESRARARALILAGHVTVDDVIVSKAGSPTLEEARVTLATPDHPYVGRGGVKLAHALDVFGLDATGRDGLDIGASTGGFTDVLLQRGARRVVALDVGHGQLAWKLRTDSRVIPLDGVNARRLATESLPADLRSFDIVTVDVAFISVRLILDSIPPLLNPGADVIILVKPQFEAGRREIGARGVVRDPAVQRRVTDEIASAADTIGLMRVASAPSPITGAEGNLEIFLHLRQPSGLYQT